MTPPGGNEPPPSASIGAPAGEADFDQGTSVTPEGSAVDGERAAGTARTGLRTRTPGESFSFTSNAVGTWTCYCEIHFGAMMNAVVAVEP